MTMMTYKLGSTGAIVTQIQRVLKVYPGGRFGKITQEALKNWQWEHGLTADGIAGPRTLAAMGISAVTPAKKDSVALDSVTSSFGGHTITLKRSKRRIDYIAIHCTATPEGRDLTVESIRHDHLKRGFSDVGYHYIVYRDGSVHAGRDVNIAGAHVTGYNSYSIGIAYVGGLENDPKKTYQQLKPKDTRTEAQKAAMLALLMDLRKLYPKAVIKGHRDFSPDLNGNGTIEPQEWVKDCPSFDAKFTYRNV